MSKGCFGFFANQPFGFRAVEGQLRRRVLDAFFYLLDVLGGGQVLGERAADALDRFADFAADLLVGLDGMFLIVSDTPAKGDSPIFVERKSGQSPSYGIGWPPTPSCPSDP